MWGDVHRAACLAACLALATSGGCRQERPAAPRDDVLVLEVGGGEAASLRATLTALGRSVEPPRRLVERASPSPAEPPPGAGRRLPEPPAPRPEPDPTPEPEPQPVPAPPPEWTVVEMQDGDTLIHVARRHLGDGRRYGELMEWNGWNEADARRLRVGQKVRVKTSELP